MKFIVLGASGKTGSWVVKLAQKKGHNITAVIRPSSNYQPPDGIKIIKGEVTEESFLKTILDPESVLISCIGINRNGLSPWAKILSPSNLVETINNNIINALPNPSEIKLVWISAGGVGSSKNRSTWIIQRMINLGNIKIAYKDLESAEESIRNSELNYQTVRPVTLINGLPKK